MDVKRKLKKAFFNASSKPLSENIDKSKRRKAWFGFSQKQPYADDLQNRCF